MNPKRRQRLVLILSGVLLAGTAAAVILYANSQSISWYKHPSEIAAGDYLVDQKVRIGGLVKAGSFRQLDQDTLKTEFLVTDCMSDVKVSYNKILPDLFREGQSVVVEGKVIDGVVKASQVLAKHDEKYMPPEAKAALDAAQQGGATCDASYAEATQ
ncbi:cytochrome c maturation protein CcmE [Gynuella sp.]|uniref:cytochrome c maturation protein CcmE n=1 Tax=Gynuella sp. TaxID=2969146 RepID=UPI003D1334DC